MSRLEIPAPLRRCAVPALFAASVLMLVVGRVEHASPELGPPPAAALEDAETASRTPIVDEIGAVFAERDAKLERLGRLHDSARDLETRLALEREIGDVKRRAILEMFRVQRRHALERGDAGTAEVMDASIRRIEHRLGKGAILPPEDVPAREAAPEEKVKP